MALAMALSTSGEACKAVVRYDGRCCIIQDVTNCSPFGGVLTLDKQLN